MPLSVTFSSELEGNQIYNIGRVEKETSQCIVMSRMLRIGWIGGGKMAQALAKGIVSTG